ncbi:DUF3108 domain-containing protein [Roseateles sp. NT4]|uniref:DUF3108 domain-containing protein n=1 Tax=Roseateles sp. NT4 TaxID=3453715 RepID=UPI003EEAD018
MGSWAKARAWSRVVAVVMSVVWATPGFAQSAPQAITVGTELPRMAQMKEGPRVYVRFRELKGVTRPLDIWRREVKFETVGGERRLHISQSWTGPVAAPTELRLDSWFGATDFKPLTHERFLTRAEEKRNEGFQFSPSGVTGLSTTPENTRAGFTEMFSEPAFNFETDMELLEALPLADGWRGRVMFYHPGGGPAAPYVFTVEGSRPLPGVAGTVDCWLVTLAAEKADGGRASRFYVDKRSQQVLRVEQPWTEGSVTVKVRLY